MNIAPSTASATPTPTVRPDGPTTGHIVSHALDGVDVVASSGTPVTGFGSLLSRHLHDARSGGPRSDDPAATMGATGATGSAGSGGATTARATAGVDPALRAAGDATDGAVDGDPAASASGAVPATDAASAAAAAALFPALATSTVAATSASTVAVQDPRDGSGRKGRVDDDAGGAADAGSDLAAQLALASQWAGVARPADPSMQTTTPPVSTAVAATAVGSTARGGVDAKSASARDRATSGKDDATPTRGAASLPAAEPAAGLAADAARASADATGADPHRGDDRAATAAFTIATKDSDTKARGDGAPIAPDAASTAVAAATGPVDAMAAGDLFGARLAAHAATAGAALMGSSITGASATTTAATSAAAATSMASAAFAFVQEPVGSTGWSHEVGQAALRMAASDLQSASIRLNPEHLGPLDVQVRVDDGVAHLAFTATHADTRQALEASRGTLDQLFAGQGLKMGDVSVGGGSNGGSNGGSSAGSSDAFAARGDPSADGSRRDGGSRWSADDAGADHDAASSTVTTRIARALGLVDTFA